MLWSSKKRLVIVTVCIVILIIFLVGLGRQRGGQEPIYDGGAESGSEQTVLITDTTGPFTVSYLGVADDGKSLLSVSDSSPPGRIKAIRWIQDQGFDLLKTEIQFVDFNNPLISNGTEKDD